MCKKIVRMLTMCCITFLLLSPPTSSYIKKGSTPEKKKQGVVVETGKITTTIRPSTGSYAKDYISEKPEYIPTASPGQTVGYTFYDFQANYRLNKQAWVDKFGKTSVAWMKSFDVGVSQPDNPRSIYFNWRDINGNLLSSLGVQVGNYERGGFSGMAGLSDSRSVIYAHEATSAGTIVAIDSAVGTGIFVTKNPPDSFFVDTLTNDTTFLCDIGIWPGGHVDLLDRVHIIANEGNNACSQNRIVYTRSLDSSANSWTPPQLLDSVISIPAIVAVSFDPDTIPYDDTGYVALVWVSHVDWTGCGYELEIYYRKSTDGGTTFGPRTQLTNHTGLPYRPYGDISAIIDNSGTLHVVYTGIVTDLVNCIQSDEESYIIHVAEGQSQTIIQDGIWGDTKPGVTATNVCKPSIGMAHSYTNPGRTDEKGFIEGRLYCTWVQFNPGDRSAKGMSNGEIYGAYSKSNGLNWGGAVNLTKSPTPGCIEQPKVPSSENTGTCDSDHWQSLADLILNDTLSILYINDKVAGRFDEGLETKNPVKLLRVDANILECVPCGFTFIPDHYLKNSPIGGPSMIDTIIISNCTCELLTGNITKTQDWLTLSQATFTIPESEALKIYMTISPGNLEQTLTDTITISSNAVNNPIIKVPVDVVVSNNYFKVEKAYLNTPRLAVQSTLNLANQEDTAGFYCLPPECDDTLNFLFDGSLLLAFKSNAGDTILARHIFNSRQSQPVDSLRGPKDTTFVRDGITYDIEALACRIVPFTPESGPRWPGYFYGLEVDWELQRVIKGGDTIFWVARTELKTSAPKPGWWPTGNVDNVNISSSNPLIIGWGLDWDIPDSDSYSNSNDTNVAFPYDSDLNLCTQTRLQPEHTAGISFYDPTDTTADFTTYNVRESQIYIYPSSGYEPVQIYKMMVNDSTKLILTPKPDSLDMSMIVGKKYITPGNKTLYWILDVENPGLNTLKNNIGAARDYLKGGFQSLLCFEVEVGDLALPLNNLRTPADVVTLINYVFKSRPLPSGVNPCAADINKSGGPPSPADVITLINNVFKSRPLPAGDKCGC